MKISAITCFKQGDIFEALQKLGWTQSELARQSGLSVTAIGHIINLKTRPTEEQANAIQNAFAKFGVYVDTLCLRPPNFKGIGKKKKVPSITQTAEVDIDHLLYAHHVKQLNAHNGIEHTKLRQDIESMLSKRLNDREKEIIFRRFWDEETLNEVGKALSVTGGRIRELEARALRKLRHPKSLRIIDGCYETIQKPI